MSGTLGHVVPSLCSGAVGLKVQEDEIEGITCIIYPLIINCCEFKSSRVCSHGSNIIIYIHVLIYYLSIGFLAKASRCRKEW